MTHLPDAQRLEEFFKDVKNNNTLGVSFFLEKYPNAIESRDSKQRTALMLAVVSDSSGVLLRLLEAGADVDAQDSIGYTPLMTGVLRGDFFQVGQILKKDPDVMLCANDGRTNAHTITLGILEQLSTGATSYASYVKLERDIRITDERRRQRKMIRERTERLAYHQGIETPITEIKKLVLKSPKVNP